MNHDWSKLSAQLADDGAIIIPGGFDEAEMQLVDTAFQWMVDNPGPGAEARYSHEPATFYESTGYAPKEPVFPRSSKTHESSKSRTRSTTVATSGISGSSSSGSMAAMPDARPGIRISRTYPSLVLPSSEFGFRLATCRDRTAWSSFAVHTAASSTTARVISISTTTPTRSIPTRRCHGYPTSKPTGTPGTSSPGRSNAVISSSSSWHVARRRRHDAVART